MDDLHNVLVLTITVGCIAAFIVGYILAWRSKRVGTSRTGLWMAATVSGIAGLFMLLSVIGAVMPFPPPDGTPVWEPLLDVLLISPLPLGALYFCAKFIRRARRDGQAPPGEEHRNPG